MHVAVVHSLYSTQQPSGENVVVLEQVRALHGAGHEVSLVLAASDDKRWTAWEQVLSGIRVVSGAGKNPRNVVDALRPDVVHVHNLFPNFGDRWLRALGVPTVATLHNYRPLCSAGTFFRDGRHCTLCPDEGSQSALVHRCYNGSVVATAPLAIKTSSLGRRTNPVFQHVDLLVVLSDRSRALYMSAGVSEADLRLVPNFVRDRSAAADETHPSPAGWAVVGRLTPEKGVLELVQNWVGPEKLHIYGDGPLRAAVEAAAIPEFVSLEGVLGGDELRRRLRAHRGLAFPSLCAEGAIPLVYVEALAEGLPVIAVRGNGASDHILRYGTGWVVPEVAEMAASVRRLPPNRPLVELCMGNPREIFREQFTEQRWADAMGGAYSAAIERHNLARSRG